MKNIFVTAIGTNSGKTLASTILTEALQADYWKPLQCGIEDRDANTVEILLNNNYSIVHATQHEFNLPASPHQAAFVENRTIQLSDFTLPYTNNTLVIEGAGGIMVPLNYQNEFVIDFATLFQAQIILVSDYYLGSINHTLLTINELKRRNLPVKGIIFNGDRNEHSEKIILQYSGYRKLLHIPRVEDISQYYIKQWAIELMKSWHDE